MLTSLGWDPETGRENLPLLLSAFSKDDFDVDTELWNKVGNMSENDRNKFIWKRILNNLPFILKAKGTEAAINALINCYGIPRNLVQIREYGGIDYSTETNNESLFIFDETKYSPYFSGSAEYFQLPWSGSVQSVEMNFTFDTNQINPEGSIFRLISIGDRAAVGIVREKGNDWGRAFFTIQDTGSNLMTISTARAPLFDGNTYSLLLRKEDISTDFNLSSTSSFSITDPYPQKYDLIVKRNEDSRTTFEVSTFKFLSGSFNTSFRSASFVYFGNYSQNTASLGVDPDSFFGTLDEIRLWELPLTDERFDAHASYKGSYDLDDPRDVVTNLLARISFTTPMDLCDPVDGSVSIPNIAFKQNFPILTAVNFPPATQLVLNTADCQDYIAVPLYPYQFQKIEMIQSVKLANFGSNKFKSNKIKFKEQQLVSNLSPDSRSTLKASQDSDVDSNKLGVFFSPGELINTSIIKFFGAFEFGDLIGGPTDVYQRTYKRFDNFRQVFYNQGGGQIDYQTFMNLVRMYFDKSLFKYIKNLVPARAKLVEGLLIEPTLLERPKLQFKPICVGIPNNLTSSISPTNKNLTSEVIGAMTQSLQISTSGLTPYGDVNRMFYSDSLDNYGFSVYAESGVTFYKNDFYRVDILSKTGSIMVTNYKRPSLSGSFDATSSFISGSMLSATSSYDIQGNGPDRGTYTTMKKHWKILNVAQFPILKNIPVDSSMTLISTDQTYASTSTTFSSFTGSLSGSGINSNLSAYTIYSPLVINGSFVSTNVISGSGQSGSVISPIGIYGVLTNGSVQLTGTFDTSSKMFSGTIRLNTVSSFTGSFYSLDPTESAVTYFLQKATGNLFNKLRDSEFAARKKISLLNVPYNSSPLNGYYQTHFRYKKSIFSKKRLKILDTITGLTVVGTFKKGSQTQQTTVQPSNGLRDNSLPVVITKTS